MSNTSKGVLKRELVMVGFLAGIAMADGDGDVVKAYGTLKNNDETLVINLGKQKLGKEMKTSLTVQNATGLDLECKVVPSCGCTKLTEGDVEAKDGELLIFDFVLSVPENANEGPTTITLVCQDSALMFNFRMAVVYEATPPVRFSKKSLRVPHDANTNVQISVEGGFPEIAVRDVRLASDRLCKEFAYQGGVVTASIEKSDGEKMDDTLQMEVDLFDSEVGKEKTLLVSVPVEYSGLIRISPGFVQLKRRKQELYANCIVNGFINQNKLDVATPMIVSSGQTVTGKVSHVEARTARVAIVRV